MKDRWTRLNWKQKELLLALSVFVGAYFIYNFAIYRTVELANDCAELKMKIDSAALVKVEINGLENELQQYELAGKNESSITHEQLLDVIDTFCSGHSITIRDFPQVRQFQTEEWQTEIHEVTIVGRYSDAILLLDYLHRSKHGRVVSVTFYSKVDNKTKVKHLFTTIYVQNIFKTAT
jgi:hypothetical protein